VSQNLFEKSKPVNSQADIPMRKGYGMETVRVTPEIAQHWLTFNVSNRKLRQENLSRLQLDMERGDWRQQGDPIRFAFGKLLDGQHRLTAIVLSGQTIPMLVVHGIDPETQANMDTGRSRTPQDVLSIEGLDAWEAPVFGAAVHIIISYSRGLALFSSQKYLNREVRNFYLEHRASIDPTIRFCKNLPRKPTILPFSRVIALHYAFAQVDRDAADDFMSKLLTGDSIGGGSPIFWLRQRLVSDAINKQKRSAYEQMHFCVATWNGVRRGSTYKNETFMRPREGKPFPEIAQ